MADDEDPKAGELVTANYGWTKPTVGASDDQWGGYLNADLDGIDSVVHGIDTRVPAPYVLPVASTTVLGGAKVDGTTIHAAADGTLSGTPSSGPPVTISDVAPGSPQVGALWYDSVGGQLYTWFNDGNSTQWVVANNPGVGQGAYLPLNGGALSGPVSGPSATFANLSAPQAIGDNRLINGDMRIDQRNNGASGTANAYTVDRWQFSGTQTGKGAWQRVASAPIAGFPYALYFTSSSVYAPLAGDTFFFEQAVEADMVSDFQWGTAQAQPVTLSFWVYSSITGGGTFSGSVRNVPVTRSYPFSFSIPIVNTWTKIVLTIPGDTAGTWTMSGNAAALTVGFDLGSGSTFRGSANAWVAGNLIGVNGAVNSVATNGSQFIVTGVKLEIGSVATPYNRQSLAKSMADCQRYFIDPANGGSTIAYQIAIYAPAASTYQGPMLLLPVVMRAAPTIVVRNQVYGNSSAVAPSAQSPQTILHNITSSAAGVAYVNFNMTLSAEL